MLSHDGTTNHTQHMHVYPMHMDEEEVDGTASLVDCFTLSPMKTATTKTCTTKLSSSRSSKYSAGSGSAEEEMKTGSNSNSVSASSATPRSSQQQKQQQPQPQPSQHKSDHSSRCLSDYQVLDTVGYGSFGRVCRVRHKCTNEVLVWKELCYASMNEKEKQMLCDEVNILRDLNHPNIVRFVDRIIDHLHRRIYIFQEYCDGGDLASYIKMKRDKSADLSARISESFIWSVTSEIASALQHCHHHLVNGGNAGKLRILHRDLKPGNIFLVRRRGTFSVKLGDFGLAKMLDASRVFATTHVGTPYYMSPEQIANQEYDEKSDIWSLGCIVYEMAMLCPPFKASNYLHLADKIKAGLFKDVCSRNYSADLQYALSIMLTVDCVQRASVEHLLCLPRIQFTSKMLRLDRRYSQLKKKEQQFMLKKKRFERKFKHLQKKSKALLQREHELKLKEKELKMKEATLRTANCNCNSGNSNHSDESHGTGSHNSIVNKSHQSITSAASRASPLATLSSTVSVTRNNSCASIGSDIDELSTTTGYNHDDIGMTASLSLDTSLTRMSTSSSVPLRYASMPTLESGDELKSEWKPSSAAARSTSTCPNLHALNVISSKSTTMSRMNEISIPYELGNSRTFAFRCAMNLNE
eukprot:CAMPEP_0202695306 /NCGR_PEP_ID=MMETSP1385-20130828/8925_1 /ASSEMBLY_ACC=CAM_ASM_000861 /TAXON_ID=933848 /ORGANISM="Elphidium margaritaceum" /LENGTH=638 /DNA_ID=CAMNT_0049351309 /DNA_START=41 /DNA_END=1957 /DNA_ORIENTATION=-